MSIVFRNDQWMYVGLIGFREHLKVVDVIFKHENHFRQCKQSKEVGCR